MTEQFLAKTPVVVWAMLSVTGVLSFILLLTSVYMIRFFRKTNGDQAIVRTGHGGTVVDFSGLFVLPKLHQAVTIPITVQKLESEAGRLVLLVHCFLPSRAVTWTLVAGLVDSRPSASRSGRLPC